MSVSTTSRSVCSLHSRYVKGCHGCRAAAAAKSRTRTRLMAYGRWDGLVDATPARQHVERLVEAGLTLRAIARRAQLAKSSVESLASGRQSTIYAANARAILAVGPEPDPDTMVSSLGAARRLQALMASGWDAVTLAERLGVHVQRVRKWRYRFQQQVRFRVHQEIAALYRELECRPGPSDPARVQARTLGYAPPACWDGDSDLDDPAAVPKGFRKRLSPAVARSAA